MKSIKGSRTEENLLKAFAGESQARNRYTYFAEQARKEGYEQITEDLMKELRKLQAQYKDPIEEKLLSIKK